MGTGRDVGPKERSPKVALTQPGQGDLGLAHGETERGRIHPNREAEAESAFELQLHFGTCCPPVRRRVLSEREAVMAGGDPTGLPAMVEPPCSSSIRVLSLGL